MINHLTPKTAELLKLGEAERITAILNYKWIPYTRASDTLKIMEDLLVYPKSDRMPNLLLVGDSNNGKTAILKRFCKNHPPFSKEDSGSLIFPVLYIQAPPEPDERRLYNIILDTVSAPYKINDRVDKKQIQTINTLKNLQVRLLIIDEIQHILAGNQNKQRQFLNVVKYLSNELTIPFVGAGIKTALNAIQNDEQLSNRFEPKILHRWKIGEEYNRLLKSFESLIPLHNASNLTEDTIALRILSMSEGIIGEISIILKKASVMAVQNKSEKISLKLLEKINYVSPSDRMKQFR